MLNVSKIADLLEKSSSVFLEQALEYELVRGRSAQADIRALVQDDLVEREIVLGGQPCVAESREGIGSDGNFVALADNHECSH